MSGMRVGDAERDRAAVDLGEHFALGRLSADEHAERLDAVWSARTQDDLDQLFDDLPGRTPTAGPGPRRGPRRARGWHPVPFVPVAVVLIVLSVVTHLPFWIALFFLGCGLFTRRRMLA